MNRYASQSPLWSCTAIAAALLLATGPATAAPDWTKVPAKKITVFYPGVASLEWTQTGSEHGGARAMRKGETCASCHSDETGDMGKKIVSGEKLEPKPIKGKAGSIPVSVQAVHDDANLYLRFEWKAPAGGGPKMDGENAVKIAVMIEDNKVEIANLGGCWATCHDDLRTMPKAKDDKKTKWVKDGALAGGKFFDLFQFRSGKGGARSDGHVAESRKMTGGAALVSAEGKGSGGAWTVTFVRKLSGGEGDHALAAGKLYNFGFAIHDDHTNGRFHHVSLGYTLGLGNPKADLNAVRQ